MQQLIKALFALAAARLLQSRGPPGEQSHASASEHRLLSTCHSDLVVQEVNDDLTRPHRLWKIRLPVEAVPHAF